MTVDTGRRNGGGRDRQSLGLLAGIGHDLRTPLNHVIGFAELIAAETRGPLGSPAYREYAASIRASGRELLEILETVLELCAAETGTGPADSRPVDLQAEIARAVRGLQGRAGAVRMRCGPAPRRATASTVRTDPDVLRQILPQVLEIAMAAPRRPSEVTIQADAGFGGGTIVVEADAPWLPGDAAPAGGRFRQSTPVELRLALVRSLLEGIGGRLVVRTGRPSRRRMVIRLPSGRVAGTDQSSAGTLGRATA